MQVLFFVLLLLAFICFTISAFQLVTTRFNLIALGLAFWVLGPLVLVVQKL